MMLWKMSVRESRVECSKVMVLHRRGRVDQKPRDEHRQTSGVGETEHRAGGDRMKQGQASTDIAVTSMEFLLAREQKMLTRRKARPVKRM